MNREYPRAAAEIWLLLGLCVACNGGRSDLDVAQANGDSAVSSTSRRGGDTGELGGATRTSVTNTYQLGGSTSKGGTATVGGSSAGGGTSASGAAASGGRSASTRTAGGTNGMGGLSGSAIGGSSLRSGGSGVSSVGGMARAGAPAFNGETTAFGGASSSTGTTTSITGRTGMAGAPPFVVGAGGTRGIGGASGASGAAGVGGATIAAVCSPAPRMAMAGAAGWGHGASEEWYVDATNGRDIAPGTESQPLKTLSCAASVAKTGDTISLKDGTWDSTNEPSLSRATNVPCGSGAGISFAPNVRVRAVNPGAVRVASSASHGLCISGGTVEGVKFVCNGSFPVLETSQGASSIVGSSFRDCFHYPLVVSDVADVTLRPGNLTDYAESSVDYFANVKGNGHLTVEGGKFSFFAYAIYAEDNATVVVHGAAFAASAGGNAGFGIQLSGNSNLTMDRGSTTEHMSTGVLAGNFHGQITIDGLTCSNGATGIAVANELGSGAPANVTVNHLQVSDMARNGFYISGNVNVSIKNSTFVRNGAPAIALLGSGSSTINDVVVTDSSAGLEVESDSSGSGRAVTARDLQVTGSQGFGVSISSRLTTAYDFGTAANPGNNVFRDNNTLADPTSANFVLSVVSTILAVGNTWNANSQQADFNGRYSVSVGSLEVSSGSGQNFYVKNGNIGKLRLAESP